MSDKSSRGRPPLPDKDRADSFLHIRVTARDKSGWVKQAQKEGMTLAQWVIKKLG